MDRSGFEKVEVPKLIQNGQTRKLLLIRLPKDTSFKVLHNVKVDMSDEHQITTLRSMENEEYNVTFNKSGSNDIFNIRSITYDDEAHSCTTSSFAGSISMSSKKRVILSDDTDPVVPEYSKIEQLKGLKVRSLPSGSFSNVADVWKKNLEAEVRANAIALNKHANDKKKSQKRKLAKNQPRRGRKVESI